MAKPRRPRRAIRELEAAADLRSEEIARRLAEVEEIARANRRELELQFRRMAEIQAQLDHLAPGRAAKKK
jgi:predicted phage gp36 major capsid-like protein